MPEPLDNLTQPHDAASALALYAKVLSASTLQAAAHALVSSLASEYGFSRVTLGLREHGVTSLIASSSQDVANAQSRLSQCIAGAMDEAMEQGVSLVWPIPGPASLQLAQAILVEHMALQREVGGTTATIPFGQGGEAYGAVCVERHDGAPLTSLELHQVGQRLLLAAPALRWMQFGAQSWFQRARRDVKSGWQALRQPRRRTTRRWLLGAAAVVCFLAVAPLEYEVSGRARIEGAQQRVLSAPTDGFVKTAHVRPGDRVKAGAALVDLIEEDQRLERERWSSQLAQHENAFAAAMAKSDRVGTSTSLARVSEAQAQLALIDEQLLRGRMTAPFDALVIQGDLSQSIGAPVRQGDALLTLATTGQFRVIVDIDEIDIARVRVGQAGRLSLSSLPWDSQDLVVERITPLAKAVEGRNIFEVEARLAAPDVELRPGLLGRAELVVGRMPPLWALTRHAVDRIRLTWWNWLG